MFVLVRCSHEPVVVQAGTTFHFFTEDIHAALKQACAEAGERTISVAGGARTVNQSPAAGLLDELRPHVTPSILVAGERIFDHIPPRWPEGVSVRVASLVTHITHACTRA